MQDRWLSDVDPDDRLRLYEDMVVVRRFDTEAIALQRQGQLALWPPLLGQEAAQIGSARALRSDDFVFAATRERCGVCRGAPAADLVRVWRGTALGLGPAAIGMATPQVMIGSQTLHATGWAHGSAGRRRLRGRRVLRRRRHQPGRRERGDGLRRDLRCAGGVLLPEQPVGDLRAGRPAGAAPVVDRAAGYGMPGMRVDGNDVLAVLAATRVALDRARRGDGPTFIEAVTYRMGPHTTSDDPTRYVDPSTRSQWAAKDPIARVAGCPTAPGCDSDGERAVAAEADARRRRCGRAAHGAHGPRAAEPLRGRLRRADTGLERQRSQYAAYLAMFDEEA